MRTVVYDAEDMEPITVIDVPGSFLREMEAGKRGRGLIFPVYRPLTFVSVDAPPTMERAHVVRLEFKPIYKGKERMMWLCTTRDGETALLLRSVFLPGQRRDVHSREREAFLNGLLAAIGA